MERIVTGHWAAITQTAQPGQNAVKLVVDEWGAWYGRAHRSAPATTCRSSPPCAMRC